jgi:hypothetical protein
MTAKKIAPPSAAGRKRLAALISGCLAAWPAAASAAPSLCPDGANYSINENGQEFCLFENLALPDVQDVAAYCHGFDSGYLAFSWAASPAAADYVCPEGSYRTDNGLGVDFCLFDVQPPSGVLGLAPYCDHLAEGVLGYSWKNCAEGARYTTTSAGLNYCLYENIVLPNVPDVAAYCYGLADGYIGFSWAASPAAADYVCPEGSYRTDNGLGVDFCLFGGIELPAAKVKPYCKYLAKGYLGYSWYD